MVYLPLRLYLLCVYHPALFHSFFSGIYICLVFKCLNKLSELCKTYLTPPLLNSTQEKKKPQQLLKIKCNCMHTSLTGTVYPLILNYGTFLHVYWFTAVMDGRAEEVSNARTSVSSLSGHQAATLIQLSSVSLRHFTNSNLEDNCIINCH